MDSRPSPPLEQSPRGLARPMSISTISMPPSYHTTNQPVSQQALSRLLLSTSPHLFTAATQHPFLRHAGLGTISKFTLSRWLSQDRVYAQAYINFIGSLIARLHLPHHHITPTNKTTSLRWRLLTLLTSCLTNIIRELDLFDTTAAQYNLKLDAASPKDGAPFEPLPTTKQYEALFRAFGSDPSMTLLEGMVVLWATETCYLSAWKYARSFWPEERSTNPDRATDVGYSFHNTNGSTDSTTTTTTLDRNSSVPPRRPVPNQTHSSTYSITSTAGNNSIADPSLAPCPLRSRSSLHDPTTTDTSSPTSTYPTSPSNNGPATPLSETTPTSALPPTTTTITTTTTHPQPPSYEYYSAPELVTATHLGQRDLDGGALRQVFIPNWTSKEFGTFVEEIAELMDELYVREEGWRRMEVFKAVWEHVCAIEKGFWPDV